MTFLQVWYKSPPVWPATAWLVAEASSLQVLDETLMEVTVGDLVAMGLGVRGTASTVGIQSRDATLWHRLECSVGFQDCPGMAIPPKAIGKCHLDGQPQKEHTPDSGDVPQAPSAATLLSLASRVLDQHNNPEHNASLTPLPTPSSACRGPAGDAVAASPLAAVVPSW